MSPSHSTRNRMIILSALAGVLVAAPAQAARWANQFTEFELPSKWQCNLEGAEWVCQSTEEAKKKDAIIVLAAKLKGDQDSLGAYFDYLKAAKTYTSVQGKLVKSEVKSIRNTDVGGQSWVDALHLESELPGFYTRYLATVKEDIGVLITFSVNRGKYPEYQRQLDELVKSLKVFRRPVEAPKPVLANNVPVPAELNAPPAPLFGAAPVVEGGREPASSKHAGTEIPDSYLIIGAAAVALFIIWKKKRSAA